MESSAQRAVSRYTELRSISHDQDFQWRNDPGSRAYLSEQTEAHSGRGNISHDHKIAHKMAWLIHLDTQTRLASELAYIYSRDRPSQQNESIIVWE